MLLCVALAAACVLPASASARIKTVGSRSAEVTPSCPANPCEVLSRTTAFQTRVGSKRNLFVSHSNGRVVAWTINLGIPKNKQRKYFEDTLGGPASAGITVLKRGDKRYGRVIARSPIVQLEPYFGQTVQFPLAQSLPIKKGYVVALTVPTWAPALGLGLPRSAVWTASRDMDACDDTQTQSAQTDINDLTRYKCFYHTARLAYSATVITDPKPTETE
jgi:hypothetical protein